MAPIVVASRSRNATSGGERVLRLRCSCRCGEAEQRAAGQRDDDAQRLTRAVAGQEHAQQRYRRSADGEEAAPSSTEACDPLVQELDECLAVDFNPHMGVWLVLGPTPQVDNRPAAADLGAAVDLDAGARSRRDPGGRRARATASWIGEPSNPYVWEWKRL